MYYYLSLVTGVFTNDETYHLQECLLSQTVKVNNVSGNKLFWILNTRSHYMRWNMGILSWQAVVNKDLKPCMAFVTQLDVRRDRATDDYLTLWVELIKKECQGCGKHTHIHKHTHVLSWKDYDPSGTHLHLNSML